MKIAKIIIVILVILVIAAAGYYAYVSYFAKNKQATANSANQVSGSSNNNSSVNNSSSSSGKDPKATYVDFIGKMEAASTIEDAISINTDYTYFATPDAKAQALTANKNQLTGFNAAAKAQMLSQMKQILNISPKNITETVNGNNATLDIIDSTGVNHTVSMINDGGAWKIQ